MIDSVQAVLLVVLFVLTILVVVLGVQVFFILKELRKTVSKANKVLDSTNIITQSVSTPISSLSSIATGIKTGASFINLFKKILSDKDDRKKKKED